MKHFVSFIVLFLLLNNLMTHAGKNETVSLSLHDLAQEQTRLRTKRQSKDITEDVRSVIGDELTCLNLIIGCLTLPDEEKEFTEALVRQVLSPYRIAKNVRESLETAHERQ